MLTPTLFSVSYAGFWGQHRLDLPAFIHKAGQLGYRAVELMGKQPHLSILDTDDRQIGKLRDAASAAGVEIATIAGYTNFTLGLGTEVPAAEFQIAYVRQLAAMAELLGAKSVWFARCRWATVVTSAVPPTTMKKQENDVDQVGSFDRCEEQ